jgi:hypothetical protein
MSSTMRSLLGLVAHVRRIARDSSCCGAVIVAARVAHWQAGGVQDILINGEVPILKQMEIQCARACCVPPSRTDGRASVSVPTAVHTT